MQPAPASPTRVSDPEPETAQGRECLPIGFTNNQAEYMGLIHGLKKVQPCRLIARPHILHHMQHRIPSSSLMTCSVIPVSVQAIILSRTGIDSGQSGQHSHMCVWRQQLGREPGGGLPHVHSHSTCTPTPHPHSTSTSTLHIHKLHIHTAHIGCKRGVLGRLWGSGRWELFTCGPSCLSNFHLRSLVGLVCRWQH